MCSFHSMINSRSRILHKSFVNIGKFVSMESYILDIVGATVGISISLWFIDQSIPKSLASLLKHSKLKNVEFCQDSAYKIV